MGKKLTFEYVQQYFKDNNCELLETFYKNANAPMEYLCSCGNISKMKWNHFQKGVRCSKCGGSEKLTFEFVQKYFKDNGCELLETRYINSSTPMKYRCSCGNVSKITRTNFKTGQRCMKCGIEKRTESLKHTLKNVRQYFEDNDCELLENEYKNANTIMNYRCSCGNISTIVWHTFKKGVRCAKCAGVEKHAFSFIQSEFKKAGCELLETKYVNNYTLMKYRCSCGNISNIAWKCFKKGGRCMKCRSSKGEKIISEILDFLNVKYKIEKKFKGCKNKFCLPFDFYVKSHNLCIEFDGGQHFKPVEYFGGEKGFKKQQKRDAIKTAFCHERGINLLRISYLQIDSIKEIIQQQLFQIKLRVE